MKKSHLFHIVDPSPWPLLSSISIFNMFLGSVYCFNAKKIGCTIIIYSLVCLSLIAILWWRDVVREGTYEGKHTLVVQKGLKLGMILFIVSEVMFFLAFFWAYFHTALAPSIQLGSSWPPYGISVFNYADVPLLNTLILLTSGVLVTWTHKEIVSRNSLNKWKALGSLWMTIILAVIFTIFQVYEYQEASFSIADSSYGSVFFMSTGFHGLHVIIGTLFLSVCLIRLILYHFAKNHHIGLILAIWYWHFVDVVWLVLFVVVYWWGGISISNASVVFPEWQTVSEDLWNVLSVIWEELSMNKKWIWMVVEKNMVGLIEVIGVEQKEIVWNNEDKYEILSFDGVEWLQDEKRSQNWLIYEKLDNGDSFTVVNEQEKDQILRGKNNCQVIGVVKPGITTVDDIISEEIKKWNERISNDKEVWIVEKKEQIEGIYYFVFGEKAKQEFLGMEGWKVTSFDGDAWRVLHKNEQIALIDFTSRNSKQWVEIAARINNDEELWIVQKKGGNPKDYLWAEGRRAKALIWNQRDDWVLISDQAESWAYNNLTEEITITNIITGEELYLIEKIEDVALYLREADPDDRYSLKEDLKLYKRWAHLHVRELDWETIEAIKSEDELADLLNWEILKRILYSETEILELLGCYGEDGLFSRIYMAIIKELKRDAAKGWRSYKELVAIADMGWILPHDIWFGHLQQKSILMRNLVDLDTLIRKLEHKELSGRIFCKNLEDVANPILVARWEELLRRGRGLDCMRDVYKFINNVPGKTLIEYATELTDRDYQKLSRLDKRLNMPERLELFRQAKAEGRA